jgi:hypothetical protein
MSYEAFLGATDLASDFSAFVAASRGISRAEADQLIQNWLKNYRPRRAAPSPGFARDSGTSDSACRALTLG